MLGKLFILVVIAIALILAILGTFWPNKLLIDVLYLSRFFDLMLPILAAGALFKYLCKPYNK